MRILPACSSTDLVSISCHGRFSDGLSSRFNQRATVILCLKSPPSRKEITVYPICTTLPCLRSIHCMASTYIHVKINSSCSWLGSVVTPQLPNSAISCNLKRTQQEKLARSHGVESLPPGVPKLFSTSVLSSKVTCSHWATHGPCGGRSMRFTPSRSTTLPNENAELVSWKLRCLPQRP